ncbi:thiosulfate sulfurtransferase [Patella vulgata]|uniref:thiosulfate sulfurtransferase n=1 Tax=Patella vulgata TaxID=6465 RepID=UPI0024A89DA1|nr:thiosulfate sulfurtransferase [Patella vulgata]XP_055957431.1 thiosulfate sulfurtransferase [Patella vulgata]
MTFNRTRALISTNWLREQIHQTTKNGSLRILETSWHPDPNRDVYKEHYLQSHIPSSQYFDITKCATRTQYMKRNVPDLNCFTDYVQGLGVNNNTHIIAYDRFNTLSSVRTWWIFRYFGHGKVSVLDGGFKKWLADGFEVTDEEPTFKRGNFTGSCDTTLYRDYEAMCDNIKSKKEQVIDARNSESFRGEDDPGPEVKKGHMLGAKNIPFSTLFNDDGTFKSERELKSLFNAAAVDLGKPVTAMCETGLTACGLALAGNLLGKETIPVYAGSMHEWGQKAPIELCVTGKS